MQPSSNERADTHDIASSERQEGPDIPELSKKEKEKKGAGIPLPGFLGSGKIAASLTQFFGGPSTLLGGLFASPMGANLVAAGLISWGAALTLAGYTLLGKTDRPRMSAGSAFPVLSGVGSSGLDIRRPQDRSLDYVARVNQGELVWNKENPLAPKDEPKKEEPQTAPAAKPPDAAPQFKMPDIKQLLAQKGLNPDGFIRKLTKDSSSLNGGSPAAGPHLKDGQAGFQLEKTFAPSNVGARQKIKSFPGAKSALGVRNMSTHGAVSSRAMGQLKFAQNLSKGGSYSSEDARARQYSTNAFDQGKTSGGEMLGMTNGGDAIVPPGEGVPNSIPDTGFSQNVTPYQSSVDTAKNMGSNSGQLKATGAMLMMIGMGLIVTGIGLLNCTTFPIGMALIAAGTAMTITGMALLGASANQAKQADNQAQNIGASQGQPEQQSAATNCVDMAHQQGKTIDEVCPGGQPPMNTSRATGTSVHQAVQTEQNAQYRIQSGNRQVP